MSPSTAAPSSSSAPATTSFIAWLPAEVIFNIFTHIGEPMQLYHASLACRAWRSIAVDARLWEPIYWRFYRGSGAQPGSKHDRLMTQRREDHRRACMRAWFKQAVSVSLPTDFFRSFLIRDPETGGHTIIPSLMKTTFAFIEMLGDNQTQEVIFQVVLFAMQEWSDVRPADPHEGTQKIHDHLTKVFGRSPPPRDFIVATVMSQKIARQLTRFCQVEPPTPSLPAFLLRGMDGRASRRKRRLLDFHDLFVSRMNRDDDILQQLDAQTRLPTGKLDMMLRLIERHGDKVRDVLFALIATQQITTQTVGTFAASGDGVGDIRLRALDAHAGAAAGQASLLSQRNCLALHNAAQQLLGHLQRHEAIQSIRRIRDRWAHHGSFQSQSAASQSLRERVFESCIGIEDVLSTVALFRFGEKSEISAYLDLLALHVWANLESARCAMEAMRRRNPTSSTISESSGPPTTQRLIKEIHRILHSIGFGIAQGETFSFDVNQLFLHTALWCQSRRYSHPLVHTAIVCAVARRLGVAATLIVAPATAMAIVVQDDRQQPSSPRGDDSPLGDRFFYTPGNDPFCLLLDYEETERWLRKYGQPEAEELEPLMEPASPLAFLERMAYMLHDGRERERQAQEHNDEVIGERSSGHRFDEGEWRASASTPAAKDDLGALSAYLSGRQSSLPPGLPPSVLTSSLAMASRSPRGTSLAVSKDAESASFWTFRVLNPDMVHGFQRGDAMFTSVFFGLELGHDNYLCDLTLLLGINGCDVAREIAHARNPNGNGQPEEQGRHSYYDSCSSLASATLGHSDRAQLRELAEVIFANDRQPGRGMGGAGGTDPRDAHHSNPNVRPLLDRSNPANVSVKYGMGTIFKHRSQGYHGVVVGWESVCRAEESWINHMGVDSFPEGGRDQPFYHIIAGEDESRRYIAQCNMERLRIPDGVTLEEATVILRRVIPLFTTRSVGKAFRTVRVAPWRPKRDAAAQSKGKERADDPQQGGGEVTLVMNEWMREAWPFD